MNARVKPTDEELTPPEVWKPVLFALKRCRFDLDPCSHPQASVPAAERFFSDGLRPWPNDYTVWCNPPYSNPYPWAELCAIGKAVLLVSGDTSTKMWREIIWPRAMAVVFWYGRIKFYSPHNPERPTGAKRSSALAIFGDIVKDWAPLEAVGKIIVP